MENYPLRRLSLEVVSAILSYLEYQDLEKAFYSCRAFYLARPYVMTLAIQRERLWLINREGLNEIPREELIAHNSFLWILHRTFAVQQPDQLQLEFMSSYFAQEMISAYLAPTNAWAESRCNNSLEDQRLYHQRYPLLRGLATILRRNAAGAMVARIVNEWLATRWREIKDEEEVRELMDPQHPVNIRLRTHQIRLLCGIQSLALFPIAHFVPNDEAAEDLRSWLNDEAWADPVFDRLKLWLSITEIWNLSLYHVEQKKLEPRSIFRIRNRPFVQIVLHSSAESVAFSVRLFKYLRYIELTTSFADEILGSRYWYEEAFCAATIYWAFYKDRYAGSNPYYLKKHFIDLIHGHLLLFGGMTLSDLIRNIVFFMRDQDWSCLGGGRLDLQRRVFVGRMIYKELLVYGYDFLSEEARDALARLQKDETGQLLTWGHRTSPIVRQTAIRGPQQSYKA